ncbi:hypothetical protein BJY00DRAFT_278145 [Aspergillus carlsbadensis]|nr:hypothetical protein BJY00DRAFT_278145 [Aspergillus carlsbadensis]
MTVCFRGRSGLPCRRRWPCALTHCTPRSTSKEAMLMRDSCQPCAGGRGPDGSKFQVPNELSNRPDRDGALPHRRGLALFPTHEDHPDSEAFASQLSTSILFAFPFAAGVPFGLDGIGLGIIFPIARFLAMYYGGTKG